MKSSAIAHSNIALIKYWGRSTHHDPNLNIPLNNTVSMTKYGLNENTHLQAHTTIDFSNKYKKDTASLNGESLDNIDRILNLINPLRKYAGIDYNFRMASENDFPTQAGLASSAAGFAALAIAAADALNLDFSKKELSTYARLGSGSAARSIHGGFVYWHKGNSHESSYCEQICGPDDFDMGAVIAIIKEEKKKVISDAGHNFAETSPFNDARIQKSQEQAKEIKKGILDNDFTKVGEIAEKNCKYMHAVMMTSDTALFYWDPDTLRVIKTIETIRKDGLDCYFTIDAGPNVHTLCRQENMYELQKLLEKIKGVKSTIPVKPADDSYTIKDHLF